MKLVNVEVSKIWANNISYEFNNKIEEYETKGYKSISADYYERKEFGHQIIGYNILFKKLVPIKG